MRYRVFNTVRWRFIYAFFQSIILTVILLFIMYRLGIWFVDSKGLGIESIFNGFRWLINNIGSFPLMIVVGLLSFLLFFFFSSRRIIRYLEEITGGLQEISKGNLEHRIEVRTADELGYLAENINVMAKQLAESIEEERNAETAKNDLITGVSHDLRTPLTSILGFLEYIEQDRYQDEIELRHYVAIAYEKSLNLKKLIDDLFEYTRISSRGIPLDFRELNLNHFIQQLADEFVPILEKARMTYRIIEVHRPLIISADPIELLRAYQNLLTNAVRYGSKGGKVDIRIRREGEEAVVSVVNYGDPIPKSDLPHIFDRFYRGDKSRSGNGGSGLGLAITRTIVQLHGGTVTAESSRRETEFITRFPLLQYKLPDTEESV
ncbi:two-component sensor histidine kinase [Paenibacillus sp. CAA11]|uniref:sensor histidine kinase n=1 Tax=Paenibacillus sp. CAA11 TaxID=1532905 RepID=UPI000D3D5FC1|nr:two-component sensor histidine kinase [Paenibacillus sp. CAA11]